MHNTKKVSTTANSSLKINSAQQTANQLVASIKFLYKVSTSHLSIVAPVRQFLTFGAAVRAPGARTRPNAAPSTWCGSFMTKDRN